MRNVVDISTSTFIRALLIVSGAWFVWLIRDVLIFLVVTVVLSAALHPSISWLERRGIPRPAGILSLYAVLISLATIIVLTFAPVIVTQVQQLIVALGHELVRWTGGNASSVVVQGVTSTINTILKNFGQTTIRLLSAISNTSLLALLGGILIYYLTVDHGNFRRYLAGLIPSAYRPKLIEVGNTVERRLALWLRGQLTLGLVIAVFSGIGLTILHIKYALVLALIAGISELVPMIGPYIGMLPAAAIGFSLSPLTGLLVVLLYYAIQQVENNFLAPKIVSRAVGLRPVVVFLAILSGAHAAGVIGIIMAVPAVIICQAMFEFIKHVRADRLQEGAAHV